MSTEILAAAHRSTESKNGLLLARGYCRTLIGNPMLKVEPTSQHGPITTRSGRNSFDLDKFTLSVSWKQNMSRTSLAAYHLP